jgi:hypothetical protein
LLEFFVGHVGKLVESHSERLVWLGVVFVDESEIFLEILESGFGLFGLIGIGFLEEQMPCLEELLCGPTHKGLENHSLFGGSVDLSVLS